MMVEQADAAGASVDPGEIGRFNRLAADWWNPQGSMKALHRINPLRIGYVRDRVAAHFDRDATALDGLRGLRVADIGCGAGLLCEPMARLGADVVGVDAAATNIEVARLHAARAGLAIDYRCAAAEDLLERGERFDLVLAMEVVEHVVDPPAFLKACAGLLQPGGLLVVSTINRTMKAFALAIVGAEYILGWVPRGTHSWDRFVTPEEIEGPLRRLGLVPLDRRGVVYNPLIDLWRLSQDTDVNYMVALASRR